MNHKVTMANLERLKIDKLHEVRELQKEISKIEESISFHRSIYLRNEKKADDARIVLAGYKRENVREIIKFIISSLRNTEGYFQFYKDIDLDELMDEDSFFDFVIVEMGAPTIKDLKKSFVGVEIHDGEEKLRVGARTTTSENTRNRLWKKLTKKTITTEAKRLIEEKNVHSNK